MWRTQSDCFSLIFREYFKSFYSLKNNVYSQDRSCRLIHKEADNYITVYHSLDVVRDQVIRVYYVVAFASQIVKTTHNIRENYKLKKYCTL